MKMYIKRAMVINVIFISTAAAKLIAQTPDFSGVWVLSKKISLSGPDYGNGLPKQFELNRSKDSLIIERVYEGGKSDYTITEAMSTDGKPTSAIRSNNITRKSEFKTASDPNSFSIEVSYTDMKTGKQASSNFVETWSLISSGKELTIEKKAKDPNGDEWAMKGIYQLKTKENLENEGPTGRGIQFEENLTWDQVKEKAKRENKLIFVDCFATWCIPCKRVEKELFSLNRVGTEMKDNFIAVRVQMDTTKKDSDTIKKWYPVAHEFLTKYNLVGYPSFLFFDANGNVLHQGLGDYKPDQFIELLRNARDSNTQYFSLLKDYQNGNKDNPHLDYLALTAKFLGKEELAEEIIIDYKNTFLNKLQIDSLLSEKYLKLANIFQPALIRKDGSKGIFFKLLYEKGYQVDRILNQIGFSNFHIDGIITKEEIEDKVYEKGRPIANPQWNSIRETIKNKYKILDADKLVLTAQIQYYKKNKDGKNQVKYLAEKIKKYGPLSLGQADGSGSDNTITSVLLPYCNDNALLAKAIGWIDQIIHSNAYMYPIAMVYGNYGGILYKAGRQKEGIEAFEKHLTAIGYKGPADIDKDPRFKAKIEVLSKMKRGEKIDSTWQIDAFF